MSIRGGKRIIKKAIAPRSTRKTRETTSLRCAPCERKKEGRAHTTKEEGEKGGNA